MTINQNKELYLGPWQWHLIYSLQRAASRTKDRELAQNIQKLSTEIVGGEIVWIGLIARWTELLTRKQEQS